MPMSRYEIRNEYSLADPELYQTADKDDPEALLEGVAMAGLVGLLRQLGDLAEFAAEIFHNLHEEVVATAARGHGLMVRVQQLEAEIPIVEKAFLSQTDHSSFFYHAGVDWHPNIRTDQNIVTQGDFPRFVMDSYEECREPPRLFLLDKFDVAGAGACLKRYTDPSFYKVESIDMSNANMQREKKIFKAKRKGPRWKNEEVPETLPVSHAKLHQLFLEEHAQNRVSNSSSRVKLKRRLNGYPFDARTGKSYMEKLLRSSSPDHEVPYEVCKDSISIPLMLITNEQDEPKYEGTEDRQLTPDRLRVRRKRSHSSSPVREKIMKPNDIPADDMISDLYPSIEADEMSSTHDSGSCGSAIGVDAGSKREDSLLGYHSDDISSEIDYVDAPSTVETEMDTDSEMRAKGGSTSSYSNNQPLAPDADEENRYSRSDSQSLRYSLSDRSNSPKKEISNHSSDSSCISAENSLHEKTSVENFPCADIPEIVVADSLSDQKNSEEHFSTQQYSETMVCEGAFSGSDAVTVQRSDFEHACSMPSNDSPHNIADSDSEVVRKDSLSVRRLHNTVWSLDDEEKKAILVTDHHCFVADSVSQKRDDCPEPSEHPLYESDCKSTRVSSDTDSEPLPGMVSLDNQRSVELDHELLECPENHTGKHPDVTQNKDEIKPWVSDDDVMDKIEIKSLNVSTLERNHGETSLSSDQINDVEDNHTSNFIDNQICTEESNSMHLLDSPDLHQANLSVHGRYVNPEENTRIDDTDATLSSDACEVLGLDGTCAEVKVLAPPSLENLEEAAAYYLCNNQEKLEDFSSNSFPTTEEIEEHVEIICSAPEILEEAAESPCFTQEELEESAEQNSLYPPENSKEDAENSCRIPEDIEVPAECSGYSPKKLKDIAETLFYDPDKLDETIGNSCSASKMHEVPVFSSLTEASMLDESDEEEDKANSEEMASAIPAISSDSTLDYSSLALNSEKMDLESMLNSEDIGLDEPENDENVLCAHLLEPGFMEDEVDQSEADTSVLDKVFLNSINHNNHKPEVAEDIKHAHLNLEICNTLEVFHPATVQSLAENGSLDQEFHGDKFLNSDFDDPLHGNHNQENSPLSEKIVLLPNKLDRELSESGEVSRLPDKKEQMMNHNNEEVVLQGKHNLPPDHLRQELQRSGGTRSDSSPRSPINHQDMPDPNNQFSASELQRSCNYEFNLPVYPNDALAPDFPPPNPFTGTDQINLNTLPPLPPLPPVQWRLGKLEQSLSTKEESMSHMDSFSQEIPKSTDSFSISAANAKQYLVQMVLPETKEEKVENSVSITEFDTIHKTSNITGNKRWQFVPKDSSISVVDSSLETVEHLPTSENEQKKQLVVVPSSEAEISATAEEEGVIATVGVLTQSSLSGIDTSHETIVDRQQPEIENQNKQLVLPRSEIETIPAEDDGVANGVRSLKARLPSPLIDDASVLDKSKLRKVAERVRPELKKVDERDSFLQQIKTKSFNLRPAVPSRPSIRGPSTNLKVAAILEKANAIRQALAGSDEDDDSWSDS